MSISYRTPKPHRPRLKTLPSNTRYLPLDRSRQNTVLYYLKHANRAYFQQIGDCTVLKHQRKQKLNIIRPSINSTYEKDYTRYHNPQANKPLVLPLERKIKINQTALQNSQYKYNFQHSRPIEKPVRKSVLHTLLKVQQPFQGISSYQVDYPKRLSIPTECARIPNHVLFSPTRHRAESSYKKNFIQHRAASRQKAAPKDCLHNSRISFTKNSSYKDNFQPIERDWYNREEKGKTLLKVEGRLGTVGSVYKQQFGNKIQRVVSRQGMLEGFEQFMNKD